MHSAALQNIYDSTVSALYSCEITVLPYSFLCVYDVFPVSQQNQLIDRHEFVALLQQPVCDLQRRIDG